ncbi:MAG: hypothetical protein ACFB5Z_17840 [Elainellaceae cyanobacterium]
MTASFRDVFDAAQRLSLADQIRLARQIMQLVEQKIPKSKSESTATSQASDPLIGLFSGSPELAAQSKDILHQDIRPDSGFSWKE